MTNEEAIQKFVDAIKEEIKNTGSASAIYVSDNKLQYRFDHSFLHKAAAKLESEGYKYLPIKTDKGDDFYISKDPNYELNENIKKTNLSIQETNTSIKEANTSAKSLNRLLKYTSIISTVIAALTVYYIARQYEISKAALSIQKQKDTLSIQILPQSDTMLRIQIKGLPLRQAKDSSRK